MDSSYTHISRLSIVHNFYFRLSSLATHTTPTYPLVPSPLSREEGAGEGMSHLLLEGLAGVSSGSQEEREGVRRSEREREKQTNQNHQILLTVNAHHAFCWSKVCCPLFQVSASPSPSHSPSPSSSSHSHHPHHVPHSASNLSPVLYLSCSYLCLWLSPLYKRERRK